ncbi:DUF2007 domain-containing protein [Nitriliruptor alkaliphilus]|uniref:putative signal transducing protein n=1 Tax=Nitriliruptor alkaliphilus TaxID=427918 RepID=UPI0006985748|nr:DUF2007 domain-containing protein [Nitriliruptor alkaliphilus]
MDPLEPVHHVPSVRVGRFLTRSEAEVARGLLESNGVPAVVIGDDGGGVQPDISYGYGGVAIGVHPDDVEEATALLGDIDAPIARSDLRTTGWRTRGVAIVATVMIATLAVLAVSLLSIPTFRG